MAGYVVHAQIEGPRVRVASRGAIALDEAPSPPDDEPAGEIVVEGMRGAASDWLEELRVVWAQTTFYLFHPEGWR